MEGFGKKVAKRGDLVLVNYVGSVKNADGRARQIALHWAREYGDGRPLPPGGCWTRPNAPRRIIRCHATQ
jgi:hypothetical protein